MSHISPKSTYYAIFGALMVLTALTVDVAFQHLGWLNFPVAIAIAIMKATLVVLFFMHVKYSSKLTKLIVGTTFFFLASLFGLTMTDYLSRGWSRRRAARRPPACCRSCTAARAARGQRDRRWPIPRRSSAPPAAAATASPPRPRRRWPRSTTSTPNDAAKVVEWAKAPQRKRMRFEPMPSFAHLGEARLKALAGYMLQQAAAGPQPAPTITVSGCQPRRVAGSTYEAGLQTRLLRVLAFS